MFLIEVDIIDRHGVTYTFRDHAGPFDTYSPAVQMTFDLMEANPGVTARVINVEAERRAIEVYLDSFIEA